MHKKPPHKLKSGVNKASDNTFYRLWIYVGDNHYFTLETNAFCILLSSVQKPQDVAEVQVLALFMLGLPGTVCWCLHGRR